MKVRMTGGQKEDSNLFTVRFSKTYLKIFVPLLLIAMVATTAVLMGQQAFAGSGKLEDGRFDLSTSIRFNADNVTLDALENRFQEASELLFDATDGQHQFGSIRVCNDSRGGGNADIWLLEGAGRSYVPGGCAPGLGEEACQIMLYQDAALRAGDADGRFTIVHEFGHYGYGIYDEYSGPDGDAECLEEPFTPASLMENYYLRPISEFCVDENHDPDGDTWQDSIRGESSWETMASFYPDLTIPAGLPVDDPPDGAAAIDWVVLEPETRLTLVIDRSGSMGGDPGTDPNKIINAREGAKLFTDLVSIGDKLGVVSFSTTATVDFPLTQVTDETIKENAKDAIDLIESSGDTSIGEGLEAALDEILAEGDPACQQVIILLTNGQQNTGKDPSEVLPAIKDAGIIVHTIGLGDDTDTDLLTEIADETNGRFFFANSADELQTAFEELFADSTENGGQITSALSPIMPDEVIQEVVLIDDLTQEATFLISWPGTADLDLTLIRPDNVLITPATADADPNINFVSETNHELYRVSSPQSGNWTMRIEAADATQPVEVRSAALAVSIDVSITAVSNKEAYVFPEPILVRANPMAPVNVTGATVNGTVTRPDDSSVPITLFDDGLDIHGDTFADDGVYSNFFSALNEDGVYSFQLTATTSGGFLFTGEGIDAFPDLGFIPPSGASETPAPVFTRTSGFSIDVSGVPLADLSVAKQDSPEPVAAGDPLVYSIIVTNHGPDGTGADVIVVDTLPEGVTYLSDTSAAGCTEAPTGTLTCRLANLAADESKQIDVTVMLDRAVVFNAGNPILISNTAQASSLAPDPDLTNNSATEETLVVAVADLKIVSLEAVDPPTEILVGEDVDITLRTAITNLGPSAPMDVELTRTATAPPDSTVTPSAPPPALEQALAFQEVRTVDEVFTINCSQPSMHTFIFTNEIQPFRKYADPSLPDDSDPKQDNNQTELNVNIECVVPVAINIHPGGFPNPINPGKGSATVAVLTTDAGEYGLPLAFDATTIDPLSVRFDSAKGLEGSYTAAEIHNQGHIQDSIERQLDSRGRESVTDGDQDMVLHFRVSDTSIDDDTAEACVKGEWIDVGGVVHKFFGCDSVNIVAQR